MKRFLFLLLAVMLVFSIAGCKSCDTDGKTTDSQTEVTEIESTDTETQDDPLNLGCENYKSVRVQCREELAFLGLNADKLGISKELHLPILKIDSLEELESFKSLYNDTLRLDIDHNYKGSFYDVTECYDKDFFVGNSLFIVDLESGSGSYTYGVESVYIKDQYCTVYVEKTNAPELVTWDMVEWLIIVPVEKSVIKDVSEFDAIRKIND